MFYVIGDEFPHPSLANEEGLLAIGGNLLPETLIKAYSMGIFPWYNEDEPILWWSPNPRLVLYPKQVKVSSSMKQLLKKQPFDYSINHNFESVIGHCRQIREDSGTWISKDIVEAYTLLQQMGYALSVEVWQNKQLVGGLYGVLIGKAFFGESMFALVPNASKAAIIWFCYHCLQQGIQIIDCQQSTPHLKSMGAVEISRDLFLKQIQEAM